ncbi:MAG TPA: hypothetical protein VER12_07695 [Polyangiaceae bacterium]|nr:hypothetical protein [Polyangiaceae bacterium]
MLPFTHLSLYFTYSRLVVSSIAPLALLASLSCTSQPSVSPFSAAEANQALAPARQLRPRCYESSSLARAKQKITLEFQLEVAPSGAVRATPTFAEPEDPELIECARHELNKIVFPARGRDRLHLHFEMGP